MTLEVTFAVGNLFNAHTSFNIAGLKTVLRSFVNWALVTMDFT